MNQNYINEIDNYAKEIIGEIMHLAEQTKDIASLSALATALNMFVMRASDNCDPQFNRYITASFYDLYEYLDILAQQKAGKNISAKPYIEDLKERLLQNSKRASVNRPPKSSLSDKTGHTLVDRGQYSD